MFSHHGAPWTPVSMSLLLTPMALIATSGTKVFMVKPDRVEPDA